MATGDLKSRIVRTPSAKDGERVRSAFTTLGDALDGKLPAHARSGPARELLAGVFASSPYLTRLIHRDPAYALGLFEAVPEEAFEALVDGLRGTCLGWSDQAAAQRSLRQAKARAHLVVALSDIAGAWVLERVTGALTRFADTALQCALRFCLKRGIEQSTYAPRFPDRPEAESGIAFIAMGKYGAGELNYSSDIDFSVFFDEALVPTSHRDGAKVFCVRITQQIVTLLQDRTGDGYVFRTDLRLRPDPGSTQVAVSMEAAEAYYETLGQHWERAAMIKARPAAGDMLAGAAFLDRLKSFVWRRHLDYTAIEDIHAIKRQIHAQKGHDVIAVAGHNIKLGRGGIREIEFFAQTQQLIMGGRDELLRGRMTIGTLKALVARGHVDRSVAETLISAYRKLREIEHRLQMIEDEQTHTIPTEPAEIERVARFCGYGSVRSFESDVRSTLTAVHRHYAELFAGEDEPPIAGNLVFTGVEDDPDTLATIRGLGFSDPAHVSAVIRSWHHGGIRATRSERARALLTTLIPLMLRALSETANPDEGFRQFDRFLQGLPAGVQIFALLNANPDLLRLVADILGTAPRLASVLARSASLLDSLIDQEVFDPIPEQDDLIRDLSELMSREPSIEHKLDRARVWARELGFRVGIQLLRRDIDAEGAARGYTNLADATLVSLLPLARAAVGAVSSTGDVAILALGKLGGREMTATSDLDLIFVYDLPPSARPSGASEDEIAAAVAELAPTFARLSQRMISFVSAQTGEGGLYEVDTRLRPSGKSGPVATSLPAFARYHKDSAWTWEHMALTRARVVAGPIWLKRAIASEIRAILAAPRDVGTLRAHALDMRDRLARERPPSGPWDLKLVPGGQLDVEFIAQVNALAHGAGLPDLLVTNTRESLLAAYRAGCLPPKAAESLIRAATLYANLTQVLRLCLDVPFQPEEQGPGLKRLLCEVAGVPDFAALEALIERTRAEVSAAFALVVGEA